MDGPYSLLNKIVDKKLKCEVYTRHMFGLRGVLLGHIVAFDRYMNLAMIDVEEYYSNAPTGKVIDHQKSLSVALLKSVIKQRTDATNSNENTLSVKKGSYLYKTHSTFHGGYPKLYHRQLKNLYVKGDSIVLVTLHATGT